MNSSSSESARLGKVDVDDRDDMCDYCRDTAINDKQVNRQK